MKYIIFDDGELERGIAFPDTIQHRDMADACKRFGLPVSAGFICGVLGKVYCFGEFDSLGIKSRKGDGFFFKELLK